MRKFLSLLLTMAMVLSLAVTVNAAAPKEDITILHTNDVHCDYEKYAKVATLHKSADLLVDAGDHVQGDVIGTLSKGEYIVDIMNYIKYDAAVPGNHEFDYGMDQFLHIAKDLAKYPYLSANFTGKDGTPYFDAYKIFEVKGVKVAFVGVCTPETFTKSTPTYFQDANGNYIYGFCEGNNGADLYKAVQKAIDAAKAAGADYVIGLGHLGIDEQSSPWTSKEVIANTTGFDAFIDGHSHSTLEDVKAAAGGTGKVGDTLVTSTGTKLESVGVVTIDADGTITTSYVGASPTADDSYGIQRWIIGSCKNALINNGTDPNYYADLEALEETARVNPFLNFTFDRTNVEGICASILNVYYEYGPQIDNGVAGDNWEELYNNYMAARKDAGIEELVTEFQNQLNAYIEANNITSW